MADPLKGPYAKMAGAQSAYNAWQEEYAERHRHDEGMYRPSAESVEELRRQQAAFKKTEHAISRDNAWMAVPALAPAAVILGLEAAGMIAARMAPGVLPRAPHRFVQRDPYPRVGDNWATRGGRQKHTALAKRIEQKPDWESEPTVVLESGKILRPDVRTPARVRVVGQDPKPYQMELKPNTESGRRAAAKAVKKYEETGVKTRVIYYDPKPLK
ncbi:MAG: hypothetical protein Q8M88_15240 [Phenylobacterium sp.]|uniref:hypothetical protein n=1 Tax=Phenylobacterium sp. TaxID=1871053 RepID=UPI0027356B0E|nr:hypothetical protein [Phenylobacterium sp.]MDP3175784.1 hypothetical protein [Phenylobacterium sp.]